MCWGDNMKWMGNNMCYDSIPQESPTSNPELGELTQHMNTVRKHIGNMAQDSKCEQDGTTKGNVSKLQALRWDGRPSKPIWATRGCMTTQSFPTVHVFTRIKSGSCIKFQVYPASLNECIYVVRLTPLYGIKCKHHALLFCHQRDVVSPFTYNHTLLPS